MVGLTALCASLIELLFPSSCLGCGTRVRAGTAWCADCALTLIRADERACPRCGLVWLDPPPGGGRHVCGSCTREAPPYRRARGVFVYGGAVQEAIGMWKNRPEEAHGRVLGALLTDAARGYLRDIERPVVVPIPSTPRELTRRGFNPAAALARPLVKALGADYAPTAIGFAKIPPSSRGLGRDERAARMAGVMRGRERAIAGREVVLVDDVMTTGATASEASRACLRAGARSVDVVVLARVPA